MSIRIAAVVALAIFAVAWGAAFVAIASDARATCEIAHSTDTCAAVR